MNLVVRPSPSGRRWPEGPDEGTQLLELGPSPVASRHPLPEGEGPRDDASHFWAEPADAKERRFSAWMI